MEVKTIWTEQVSKFSLIQTGDQFKNERIPPLAPRKTLHKKTSPRKGGFLLRADGGTPFDPDYHRDSGQASRPENIA